MLIVAKSATDPRWFARHKAKHLSHGHDHGARASQAIAKSSAAEQAEVDRLLAGADQLTPQLRQAFLDALDRLGDKVGIDQIKALLEQGKVSDAFNVVDAQLVARGWASLGAAVSAATITSAQRTAANLTDLDISFGAPNPQALTAMRDYEMGLVRQMSRDSLASVRAVLTQGIQDGRNPLDVARDVRTFIGLTQRQTQAVLNYRRMLDNLDGDALQRELRDRRFDPTVERAIANESKLTPEQIDRMVERYTQRYLKYRSETIARTEAIRAVNAGNRAVWEQAATDGVVQDDALRQFWIVSLDELTCDICSSIPDLNPDGVAMGEDFDSDDGAVDMPPAHPNCRCTVFYRFKAAPEGP